MGRPSLFDPGEHAALLTRVAALSPDGRPRWGRMDPGRMLAHVRDACRMSLGEVTVTSPLPFALPLPLAWAVIVVLPWPKGAKTAPELLVPAAASFETDRAACLDVLQRLVERVAAGHALARHPIFGGLGERLHGRLLWRHVDHHLRQFGR